MKPRFVPAASSWSAEDDAKLREMWPNYTSFQLVNEFGRSRSAIVARAHRLGMKKGLSLKDRKRLAKHPARPKRLNFVKDPAYKFSKVKTSPVKASEAIKAQPFKGVKIWELQRHHCRYMHDPETLTFCGHDVVSGYSYCAHHKPYMFTGEISLTKKDQRYYGK